MRQASSSEDSKRRKARTGRRAKGAAGFAALFIGGLLAAGMFSTVVVAGGTTSASSSSSTDTLGTSSDATTTDSTPTTTDSTPATDTTTDSTTTNPAPITPTISSDQADYPPGAVVSLTSSGWPAGEAVHLFVNDDIGQAWSYNTDTTADLSGTFTTQLTLPLFFIATYRVTATGALGESATTTFTDGNVQTATVAVRNAPAPCTTNNSTFNQGDTVCAHSVIGAVTGQGNGNIFVQWVNPGGTNVGSAVSHAGNTGDAFDDTIVPTVTGTWTVKVCTNSSCPASQVIATATFTVNGRATTTAVTTSGSPSIYGSSVTFTATVNATAGNPGANGTILFQDGATTISGCSAVALNASSQATCTTSALTAGSHTINATYSGATSGIVAWQGSSGSASQSVNQKNLTINGAVAQSKTYDANTTATVDFSSATLVGKVGSDNVTINSSGYAATFANKNVGAGKAVTVTGVALSGTAAANYTVSQPSGLTASITQRSLTVGATGVNKVYDATASATVILSSNKLGADDVTPAYTSASFADKNVGTGKTVTVSGISISGADASNYSLSNSTASTTADITRRVMTVSATGVSKVYDATTSATVTLSTDKIAGDTVSPAYTSASFIDKNVGAGKAINVSGISIGGADAPNYNLTNTSTNTTADITQRGLAVSASGVNKTYDATTSATVSLSTDKLSGDVVNVSYTRATFLSKNVGSAKTVNVSGISIAGGDAANYHLTNTTATTAADITTRGLTISAAPDSRAYDGTSSSTVTPTTSGLQGTDSVSATQSFDSRNVGARVLTIDPGYTVNDGNGGNNYTVNLQTAAGSITKAALNIYATPDTKTYDASAASVAIPTYDGLRNGDSLTDLTQIFDSKNAGNRTLSVSGYTLEDGNGGDNYTVLSHDASGNIDQAGLDIFAVAQTRTYNAGTDSSGAPTTSGLQGTDTVIGLVQAYTSSHVLGTNGSTLHVTAYTVNDGNGGDNYTVALHDHSGSITAAGLDISAVSGSKTYDGTVSSSGTPTVSGLFGSDSVTGISQVFESKDVLGSDGSTLDVLGYTVNDSNFGLDYTVTTHTATGTITAAALDISALSDSKVYDGGLSSTKTPAVGTLYSTDTVTGLSQAFESKDVLGPGGSTLDVTGYTVNDGNGGHDYTVTAHTATGTITPRGLDITAAADSRVYDGTTDSNGTPTVGTLFGLHDKVTGLSQAFASRHVLGTDGSTLEVTGYTVDDGNNSGNYTVHLHDASGTITPAGLAIDAVSDSKTYDGTRASSKTPTHGTLYNSDTVTATQSFDTRHAGTRTLSVDPGYTISDGNSGNDYTVTSTTAAGTISARTLYINAVSDTKTYDGTVSSSKAPTFSGLQTGDSLTGLVQAFDSKDAGTRTINVSAYALADGNSGHNYAVSTNTATGTISPRATSTGLVMSPSPSAFTQAVTLTATLTGTGAGATDPSTGDGSVSFADGTCATGTSLGAAVPLNAGGVASLVVPAQTLSVTTHTLSACYTPAGPPNFTASSTSGSQSVGNMTPSVTLAGSNDLTASEGSTHTYSFTITDPDAGDTWAFATGSPTCGLGNTLGAVAINQAAKTGTFQCTFVDGFAPAIANTVTVTVKDAHGDSSNTASQSVTVNNLAPVVGSFGGQNVLSGPLVNGLSGLFTGSFSDAGVNDKNWTVNVNWAGYTDPVTQSLTAQGPFASRPVFQSGGCSQTATVTVTDKDGAVGTLTSAAVKVGTGAFLPPMTNQPVTDQLKNGQVLPVKVTIKDCSGNPITGLSPAIALKVGDLTDQNDNSTDPITPDSVSSADTTGVMRAQSDGTYMYNMKVNVTVGQAYTVMITPNIPGYASTLTLRHKIIATK